MRNLVISDRITIPISELEISFARSSGPGGQNVNKVESKVELRWHLAQSAAVGPEDREWLLERLKTRVTTAGELLVTSSKTRDQAKNRDDALDKLEAMVRAALVRPKKRKRTRPTRGAMERRLQGKREQSDRKRARRTPGDD